MSPATYDLDVYKGDTLSFYVRLWEMTVDGFASDPVNLAGSTPRAQIRSSPTATTVMAELTCTLTSDAGVIKIVLPASSTTNLTNGAWDLQITFPDGDVKTYLRGNVSVTNEVTR